jgi:hypothetical protein
MIVAKLEYYLLVLLVYLVPRFYLGMRSQRLCLEAQVKTSRRAFRNALAKQSFATRKRVRKIF